MASFPILQIISDYLIPEKNIAYEIVELNLDKKNMFYISAYGGDVIARLLVLSERTDNIYVHNYRTCEEKQLTFKSIGNNLHISDYTSGIDTHGLKSTAERVFALYYFFNFRLKEKFEHKYITETPFLSPINFIQFCNENTYQITRHQGHLPKENKRIHAISIIPKKKDGTTYLYKEKDELNLQVDISAHGISLRNKDMLNFYRAMFDLPLLKDTDTLEYLLIYNPINGLECSLPWYAWNEFYINFTTKHSNYDKCEIVLTVSDVDPAKLRE